MPKNSRFLIPWADASTAASVILGRAPQLGEDLTATLAEIQLYQTRAARLAGREFGVETDPIPDEVRTRATDYLVNEAIGAHLIGRPFEVRLVDLRRLYAFQLKIQTDSVYDRVRSQYDGSASSIFDICLPNETRTDGVEYQQVGDQAVFQSNSPNFRMSGPHISPLIAQGIDGVSTGQIAGISVSYVLNFGCPWVHVSQFGGRLFLSNGYHRCWALLKLGVTHAVAIVSIAHNIVHVGAVAPGCVSEPVLMGPNPPALTDFLDDSLCLTFNEPFAKKLAMVTASQFSVNVSAMQPEAAGPAIRQSRSA